MTSRTITIDINEEIDQELDRLASQTGQSKIDLARDALLDWLEDIEDARDAVAILERNEPTSGSQDVRKRLGLER